MAPLPRYLRYGLGLLGLATASTSACWAAAAGGALFVGNDPTPPGILLGMLFFALGVTLGGGWVAKRALWPSRYGRPADLEREIKILSFVASAGGRVTVAEVAARCQLGVSDSRAALERMASQGVAELHFTGEAVPVYVFPGLLSTEAKEEASPLALDGPPEAEASEPALADRLAARGEEAVPEPPPKRRDPEEE